MCAGSAFHGREGFETAYARPQSQVKVGKITAFLDCLHVFATGTYEATGCCWEERGCGE